MFYVITGIGVTHVSVPRRPACAACVRSLISHIGSTWELLGRLRKIAESYCYLRRACLSVRPYGTILPPLDEFL
jgi:hypothetical protein